MKISFLVLLILSFSSSWAHAESSKLGELKLRSHETNHVGYRSDDNDVDFMDFKVSLMYPMLHNGEAMGGVGRHSMKFGLPYPYFAFTGQLSQYIGTRSSSPVIAKRFNPELFGRYWISNDGSYIDISYEHESNGQSIDTQNAYLRKRADLIADNEDPNFANDYLSRGWDYWGLEIHHKKPWSRFTFEGTLKLKHFLEDGYLQNGAEEPHRWEGISEAKPRSDFDGISVTLASRLNLQAGPFQGTGLQLNWTTGTHQPAEKNSFEWDITTVWWDFPLTFWGGHGYNNDLTDYFKKVQRYGIKFELKTFNPFD